MGMSKFQLELLKKLPREPQKPVTMSDLANALRGHWGKASTIESMRKKIKNNLDLFLEQTNSKSICLETTQMRLILKLQVRCKEVCLVIFFR